MRIIEKKKGKNAYYYLRQSMRKNGRVVTKDKYLGTKIPKNISEIEAGFQEELQRDLYKKLEVIRKSFQKEWDALPQSARERELEEISIVFTYNTNAIEGSAITLEETREIIHEGISPNKPLREVKETERHSKIFLQMLRAEEKITSDTLLQWHAGIFGETKPDIAGKFREYLVRVGHYVAPDWQDVAGLIRELIVFINKNKQMNPVELSARAHYKFEKIHPFGDGNGRIGRLLMNSILWHRGYPMLIIEYTKRRSYYLALQKEEAGFVSYFLRRYLSVHKKRIK